MRLLLKVRQEVPYDHGSKGKRMQALTPYEKARNARIASNRQVQCLRMDLLGIPTVITAIVRLHGPLTFPLCCR